MRVEIVARPEAPHQVKAARALLEGFKRHGVTAQIAAPGDPLHGAPVAVCWGWRNGWQHYAAGKRVLVMEQGYVGDRLEWISLGWDGLNGRARFPRMDDNGSRWCGVLGLAGLPQVEPKAGGDYALVLGQVTGDASIEGVDIRDWYHKAERRLAETTGLTVHFRPHPVEVERCGAPPLRKSLAEALAGAAVAAAYNSNSLTDAALAGVPVIAADAGAMAWPVAGQGLDAAPAIQRPFVWAERLAWCQWRHEEMASGAAWEALRTAMEPGSGWSPSLETRAAAAAPSAA